MMRRGFSIVELLVACALLTLVLGMGLRQISRSPRSMDSRAVAELLASEFKLARQRAVADGRPIGIAFPSNNGNTPVSQSFYLLEGEQPRIVRVVDLGREHGGAAIFNGYWNVNPANLRQPSATPRIGQGELGAKQGPVTVSGWLSGGNGDYVFLFTPDGAVHTNDLVSFDGEFHVLVASGLEASPAGSPGGSPATTVGPNYFQLDAAGHAYTVSISPAGGVAVSTGVKAGSVPDTASLGLAVASPPALSGPGTAPPVIDLMDVLPSQVASTVPAGVDTTVPVSGYATILVRASDPDGGPLYCSARADGGTFADSGRKRMDWVEEDRQWETHWVWRPPVGASDGDRFVFTCTVEDEAGRSVALSAAASPKVAMIPTGKIYFTTNRTGDWEAFVMNWDGTAVRNVSEAGSAENQPSISWQRNRIYYVSGRNGSPQILVDNLFEFAPQTLVDGTQPFASQDGDAVVFVKNDDIWVMDRDGGGQTALVTTPEVEAHPSLSAGGDLVCFSRVVAGNEEIFVLNLETGVEFVVATSPARDTSPSFDGSQTNPSVVFTSYRDGNAETYSVPVLSPTLPVRLSNTASEDTQPVFSPDGAQIAFVSDEDGNHEIYIMNADGSNRRRLTQNSVEDLDPSWGF